MLVVGEADYNPSTKEATLLVTHRGANGTSPKQQHAAQTEVILPDDVAPFVDEMELKPAAEYAEEDDAVDEAALREFAFILAKEDLIEHLEALVEMGCTHIEDLAAIDEKELVRMAPKVVHKRKLASLRKKYAA